MTALLDAAVPREVLLPEASHVRRDIQGLRAVAVLAVILDHLLHWPSGGFVGVDVFFVISGYLITGLLLREHDRTGHISFRGFYARRIRRILPVSTLVLGATVAATYFLTPGERFTRGLVDSAWALGLASNWRFGLAGVDYFQEGAPPSPVQHYWSLAVEEQFYFVWPWVMLALLALGVRQFRWGRREGRVAVGCAVAVITISSFGYALQSTIDNPTWAYFSSLARAWELGVGALLAVTATDATRRGGASRLSSFGWALLGWAGLAGVVWSLFSTGADRGFPAPAAAVPVLFTAVVIVAGQRRESQLWLLTNPVSQYVGNISFSLYLWHFPVIVLLLAVVPTGTTYYVLSALVMLALSVVSFHLVEDPLRRSAWLTGGSKPVRRRSGAGKLRATDTLLAALAAVTLVVAGAAMSGQALPGTTPDDPAVPVFSPGGGASNTAATAATAARGDTTAAARSRCLGAATLDPAANCQDVDLGDKPTPTVGKLRGDNDKAFDCWIADHEAARTCRYGGGALSVALVGDSHAAMLLPGLIEQVGPAGWALDTYVGNGCLLTERKRDACDGAQTGIIDRMLVGEPYDLVLTTASRSKGRDEPEEVAQYAAVWNKLMQRGTKVVVIADNPSVTEETLACVQRLNFDPRKNDCQTPQSAAFERPDGQLLSAGKIPGTRTVDLTPYFCQADICPSTIGNVFVYRDLGSHLTATYSRSLGPYLVKAVSAAAAT